MILSYPGTKIEHISMRLGCRTNHPDILIKFLEPEKNQ